MKCDDKNLDFVDMLMDKAFNYKAPEMPNFSDVAPKESSFSNMGPVAINDEELEFLNAAGTVRKPTESDDDLFD